MPAAVFAVGCVAGFVTSLTTGKTLNPFRSLWSRLVVSRSEQPIRYWFGVVVFAVGAVLFTVLLLKEAFAAPVGVS